MIGYFFTSFDNSGSPVFEIPTADGFCRYFPYDKQLIDEYVEAKQELMNKKPPKSGAV